MGFWSDGGNSGGTGTPGGSSGQVQWNSSAAFAGASFITTDGATWMGLGTGTLAGAGRIRLPYAASDVIIGAKDSVGNDKTIISRVSADSYQIGPAVAADLNMTVQGNLVSVTSASTLAITGAASGSYISLGTSTTVGNVRLPNAGTIYGRGPGGENGLLMRYGNSGLYVLELGEPTNVGTMILTATGSGGSINCVLGTTYVLQVTPSAILTAAPLTGFAGASLPLREGVSTITTTNGSTTLTAAQYANPALLAAAGASAAVTWVLPLLAGTFFDIYNASTQTLTVGGATGSTVAIPTLTKARVGCWDGANYR